ncbi:bifunctional diaminohydroxyphosphoribosylaminopyrimidine deaminase/5-amino-6-(5-phosphoribosylamino)uracil reductase RibD [Motiliproteus coralliicola]|uniref:Riboflavin biosynthesis protein RibD n=1 Tax=Motiliproteus coralliicola TaxID=2283196 RepID=A0A369WCF1_9GAMM|nr:bifunctional diaminohydroxyphosphoribosylaminopyrimidine deaminase/5-amino-6-(5-phosphoribosylamino)uracil reductase RibD [Motiliproteus coralliicola]RDE18296.1 bifunctional diaminohydroxyphosphoribosylaminopyrimidine deaminase/5-amino-6-(5-phosphoribosylamino)uracil reductase RibD [Motiliproteus coralliicola]
MSYTADDHRHMARALQLAAQGLYTTEPNPRVGCVLVRDGQVVGEGYHQRAGEGHAEVNALAVAGEQARGATAYVTLEPCSHHGKTGPCCEALAEAGVAKVISAMQDPNPQVSGRGHRYLQQAGAEVSWGLMQSQAEAINPGFISRMARKRPFVRIKQAVSLDGRTAMASGESKWITGAQARSDVQRLRARSSAILTGIGTVLADDPAMTLRAEQLGLDNADEVVRRQPLRLVLDSNLQTPVDAAILQQPGETVLVYRDAPGDRVQALQDKATLLQRDTSDLAGLLEWLASERECNELLVEAGATLSGAVIDAGLADELVLYQATTLLGSNARAAFELPFDKMAEQRRMELLDQRRLGDDLRLTLRFNHSSLNHPAGEQ